MAACAPRRYPPMRLPPPRRGAPAVAGAEPGPKLRQPEVVEQPLESTPEPPLIFTQKDLPKYGTPGGGGPETAATGQLPPAAEEQPSAPKPPTILASITKETPPQEAASLRLADQGRELFERGDLEGALDRLEKAVRVDPNDPHGYYWLAQVHFRRDRYDQALAFADKAALLFSRSSPPWASQAYVFKGFVFEKIGRYADAREAYRSALQVEPENAAAMSGLSRVGGSGAP